LRSLPPSRAQAVRRKASIWPRVSAGYGANVSSVAAIRWRLTALRAQRPVEAVHEELLAMRLRLDRRIEHPSRLVAQKLGILRVGHEPAELGRIGLDQTDIARQPVEKLRLCHAVVSRLRGVRDEIAAFETLLRRVGMRREAGGGA